MAEASAESFTEALIGLGGNIGDPRKAIGQAIAMLCDGTAVRLDARSSDYRTPPWGVTDQPAFVNAVIVVATSLAPRDLFARAVAVERALGRDRVRGQRTVRPRQAARSGELCLRRLSAGSLEGGEGRGRDRADDAADLGHTGHEKPAALAFGK